MSEKIATLKNTGIGKDKELDFCLFWSKEPMIQLTQGFGGCSAIIPEKVEEPGYIQLSIPHAYETIQILTKWIKNASKEKVKGLHYEISKNKELEKTIFQEIVECERFINDLELLEIPIRLLDDNI